MAGKLHKDYERYGIPEIGEIAGTARGGQVLRPGDRRARAYAEGWNAARRDVLRTGNPHAVTTDQNSAYWAWDQGWRDRDMTNHGAYPATHVGFDYARAP